MGKVESFDCVKCKKGFKQRQNWYSIKLKCVKMISYDCKQCSKKLTRKNWLINHQKNVKKENDKKCKIYDRVQKQFVFKKTCEASLTNII